MTDAAVNTQGFPLPLTPLSRCPVCKGAERKKLFHLELFSVYQCRGCSLRYIDPCLSDPGMQTLYSSTENLKALNLFHATYYDYGDPDIPSKTVADFNRALDSLERQIPTGERSLFDVGCGNGLFLAVAKKRGWRANGCDSSQNNADMAKNKFGVEIVRADFLQYDSRGIQYDTVSFWDVLEHLSDPHPFIKKAVSMLRPNGRILVGGPNDRSLLRIFAAAIYGLSSGLITGPLKKVYLLEHVTYYAKETMAGLAGGHGLVLSDFFLTSTDLEKYDLTFWGKGMARGILALGKVCSLQNRVVAVFKSQTFR